MSFDILLVCIGNVCRSAQAERLLRLRLDALAGPAEVSVSSAGVRALAGRPMDASSARELARLGGSADGFVSTQLKPATVMDADLVLTVTRDLRSRVLGDVPTALRRTFTLLEMAALCESATAASLPELVADCAARRNTLRLEEYDVPDPIGADDEVHRRVAEVIDQATQAIAHAVARSVEPERAAG